ncbi:hypothetical protein TESG_08439 [Trichophyton tonsurans CBS 112818]|uniref:Uncharacterized protein n=2 Tax=Trichophyton TaxID=5550 RepID=F2PUT0_TRIEC|nr:hypothetical protein TESG_08439 [Trichophyton tonsurans CBS 112818]EGE05648.1 hypothetical protein TEQG_04657 [Trichophyton equinum CBS 127.97]
MPASVVLCARALAGRGSSGCRKSNLQAAEPGKSEDNTCTHASNGLYSKQGKKEMEDCAPQSKRRARWWPQRGQRRVLVMVVRGGGGINKFAVRSPA